MSDTAQQKTSQQLFQEAGQGYTETRRQLSATEEQIMMAVVYLHGNGWAT